MLGNGGEMCLIFRRILGPLNFGWALNHLVLGAQLAPGEIRLVCIPARCQTDAKGEGANTYDKDQYQAEVPEL